MLTLTTSDKTIRFSFSHTRAKQSPLTPIHAVTVCTMEIQNGSPRPRLLAGNALCHSADNFCKETGRKVALTKVLKSAKLDKSTRTLIWKRYHLRHLTDDEFNNPPVAVLTPDVPAVTIH